MTDAGGLLAYGVSSLGLWRQSAQYVDKLLPRILDRQVRGVRSTANSNASPTWRPPGGGVSIPPEVAAAFGGGG